MAIYYNVFYYMRSISNKIRKKMLKKFKKNKNKNKKKRRKEGNKERKSKMKNEKCKMHGNISKQRYTMKSSWDNDNTKKVLKTWQKKKNFFLFQKN